MSALRFGFNYGTIDQACSGKGQDVESFEDLFGKRKGIIVPKVIGVFDTRAASLGESYGFPNEKVSPAMFAVVYSADDFPVSEILGNLMKSKSMLGRVKCLPYTKASTPEYFSRKPVFDPVVITGLIKESASQSEGKRSVAALEMQLEYFDLADREFGLTLDEAYNKRIVAYDIQVLKGVSPDKIIREAVDSGGEYEE
jgi:hypothetical protein